MKNVLNVMKKIVLIICVVVTVLNVLGFIILKHSEAKSAEAWEEFIAQMDEDDSVHCSSEMTIVDEYGNELTVQFGNVHIYDPFNVLSSKGESN